MGVEVSYLFGKREDQSFFSVFSSQVAPISIVFFLLPFYCIGRQVLLKAHLASGEVHF